MLLKAARGGGADRLARCLVNMLDKQTAALISIESLTQRTSYLERVLDTGSPSKHAEGQTRGGVGVRKIPRATRSSGGTVIFSGRVPDESAEFEPSPASPSTPFHGNESIRAVVDGLKSKACLHWKQGADPTGGYSLPRGPIRRPGAEGTP